MKILDIALLFDFVREIPGQQNKGQRVEAIQRWGGGRPGDSWCAYLVTMVLDLYFKGKSPIPRLGRVQDIYNMAKAKGWLVTDPQPGDLFIFVNDQDHAHHIGWVTIKIPLTGFAGNTSADGMSSNGDRAAEHELHVAPAHIKFIRVPGVI